MTDKRKEFEREIFPEFRNEFRAAIQDKDNAQLLLIFKKSIFDRDYVELINKIKTM